MIASDLIIKKRGTASKAGAELSRDELKFLVDGYVRGEIPDYQMSSFLMAVYFSGMTFGETGILTECMLHSGDVIDLHKKIPGEIFVDKHSTGGVGDKISIPLAAVASSLGVKIPMMSGRGLGHTGGTLDKLEAIDGYRTNLSSAEFSEIISACGFAMMGQTDRIVPADKKMYALRDVTGTVESIPLITASILSKKVAEGSDALVFDVKCGNGAFMKNLSDAETLAEFLVGTAKSMGKNSSALITSMDSPLGFKTGNFLEVEESLECLQGNGPDDVNELTVQLAARMALFAKKVSSVEEGIQKSMEAISSGKALEKFLQNVELQGGDAKKLLSQQGKRRSPFKDEIFAARDGFLFVDAYQTGLSCISLGVGRKKSGDKVSADSGIVFKKRSGDFVKKGESILEVYGKDENSLSEGKDELLKAIFIDEKNKEKNEKSAQKKIILKEIK